MTPNTISYMIAGFIVIFAGVIGYAVSLIKRKRRILKQLSQLQKDD